MTYPLLRMADGTIATDYWYYSQSVFIEAGVIPKHGQTTNLYFNGKCPWLFRFEASTLFNLDSGIKGRKASVLIANLCSAGRGNKIVRIKRPPQE